MYSNYSTRCGKLFFLDKYDADLKIVEREADDDSWRGQSYLCLNCNRWHITTANKVDEKIREEELLKREVKLQRELEIVEEKRAKEESDKRLAKIKEDSADLRRMAAKNLGSGSTNKQVNKGRTKNNAASKNNEKNRVIESFGDSSNNSVLSNLDPETLKKLLS